MVVRSSASSLASAETGASPATARATRALNCELRSPTGRMAASKALVTAREARLRWKAVQVSATVAQSARSGPGDSLATPECMCTRRAGVKEEPGIAVCPAGDDVIAPFLTDRPGFVEQVLTGEERCDATVAIRNGAIAVEPALAGTPDLTVVADGRTWLRFLSGDASLVWALLRRKIRLRGSPRLLRAFARCFPS